MGCGSSLPIHPISSSAPPLQRELTIQDPSPPAFREETIKKIMEMGKKHGI